MTPADVVSLSLRCPRPMSHSSVSWAWSSRPRLSPPHPERRRSRGWHARWSASRRMPLNESLRCVMVELQW